MTKAEIERASVEAVFRLGGGELMDVPWKCKVLKFSTEHEFAFPHWYEGIPEYCGGREGRSDYPELHAEDAEYRTLIPAPNPYSGPPEELRDSQGTWKLVQTFASSGETECPWKDERDDSLVTYGLDVGGECPFCGESAGEEHGFIYLGEGSCEAIYKLEGGESDG